MEGIAFRSMLYIVEESKEDFIMTTSNNRIFFLVKVVSKEEYADSFIRGHILLNTLGHFKEMEIHDGRGDPHEGVTHWIQPPDVKSLNIEIPGQDKISIGKEDLASPIVMGFDWINKINVLCMYAVGVFNIDSHKNNEFLCEDDIKSLNEKPSLDPRCLDFGPWAVIVPVRKFTERMKAVLCEKDLHWYSNLVDYYDEKTFSGSFNLHEVPFKKHKFYEYQREFRYCIVPKNIENHQESRMFLEIGDISSFAIKMPTSKLMNAFKWSIAKKDDEK